MEGRKKKKKRRNTYPRMRWKGRKEGFTRTGSGGVRNCQKKIGNRLSVRGWRNIFFFPEGVKGDVLPREKMAKIAN